MSNPSLVAIVDDDADVREALRDLLEVEGLAVRTFDSASAFLAGVQEGFGCLVTDVRMPGLDGLELQRRLRARAYDIPVIFLSASTSEATRERALSEGAAAWLSKPVSDDALLAAVRRALDRDGHNLSGA